MDRARLLLLTLSLGLAAGAVYWAWGQREPDSKAEQGADRGRHGADRLDIGEMDPAAGVYGQSGVDPGDDEPLAFDVTEQTYGLRALPHYTVDEERQHRRGFRRRLAGLTGGGDPELTQCLALVRWAASREIPGLYGLILRYTLLLHSGSKEARRRLQRLRRSLRRLPVDRDAGRRLLGDLGDDFRLLRTPHFRLAYDTEEPFARQIGALLERVHQAFFRFFKARHFEPVPPADRLEVVIFASRADYRRHTEHLGAHLTATSGVFVSRDNRTYFYDALNEPGLDRSRKNLAASVKRLQGFLTDVDHSDEDRHFDVTVGGQRYARVSRSRARALLRGEVRRLQRRKRRVNRRFDGRNTSRAVHEIVHHMAYAASIHGRFRKSPTWLVEGLAMYFESVDPRTGRWLGPGEVNAPRHKSFLRDRRNGDAPSLDTLVSGDDGFRQGARTMSRTYNAAWALFHYLVQSHHDALFDLMANLSIEVATERSTPGSRRLEMTRVFGSLKQLERDWLRAF